MAGALVLWAAAAILLASAALRAHGRSPVTLPQRETPPPGRAQEAGPEVWRSPYQTEPVRPERRTVDDFGAGRLVAAALLALLGVAAAVQVWPFSDKARSTTVIRLPDRVAGLDRSGGAGQGSLDRLRQEFSATAGVDQLDVATYGPAAGGTGVTLFVLAGRGNLPVSKLEREPGGLLSEMLGSEAALDFVVSDPTGVDLDPGDVATRARCWWFTRGSDKVVGCELWSDTFVLEVLDFGAQSMEQAYKHSRQVVADSVTVKGKHQPGESGA